MKNRYWCDFRKATIYLYLVSTLLPVYTVVLQGDWPNVIMFHKGTAPCAILIHGATTTVQFRLTGYLYPWL